MHYNNIIPDIISVLSQFVSNRKTQISILKYKNIIIIILISKHIALTLIIKMHSTHQSYQKYLTLHYITKYIVMNKTIKLKKM